MRHSSYTAPHHVSGGHFSLAFFTGVAVGVALGMLFAPSEGRALRSQISDGAHRFGRRTADTYHDTTEKMSHWVERGRSAANAGRDAFRRARTHVNDEVRADV